MRLARGGQRPVDNTKPRGRGRGVGAVHSNKPHASVSGLGRSTHHARQLSDHMSKMSVTPILTIFSPFSVFHTKRVSRSPVETS